MPTLRIILRQPENIEQNEAIALSASRLSKSGHIKYNDMTTNPFGRSPIEEHTTGTYFSDGENEELDYQKDIPIAQFLPKPKSLVPSERSSDSPYLKPNLTFFSTQMS